MKGYRDSLLALPSETTNELRFIPFTPAFSRQETNERSEGEPSRIKIKILNSIK